MTIETANDWLRERDPASVTIEGSNDPDLTNFSGGTWTLITAITNIPAITNRYQFIYFYFPNVNALPALPMDRAANRGYQHLLHAGCRSPVPRVRRARERCRADRSHHCLLGLTSPSSEGVANAIDGTTAKYLNFDMANDPSPAGFAVTPSVGSTVIIGLAMETANDGPERDPHHVTVEGSNDDSITNFSGGNWTLIADIDNIQNVTNRYFWSYFYFENSTSYKNYRWTVITTAITNTCCMQVAEVQLLAITSSADCTKAAFVSSPSDTPALLGSPAEFFTTVNGPWPLQWYMNGVPAPGASKTTFYTDPLDAFVATNLYSVAIVGCQTSAPVHALVFTPSSTESIGFQFAGSGANGAPEYMLTNDIAGVQMQAYWNIATNGGGSTGDGINVPDVTIDSSNNPTAVTFTFQTSGTWGAGTDITEPSGRLLDGITGTTAASHADLHLRKRAAWDYQCRVNLFRWASSTSRLASQLRHHQCGGGNRRSAHLHDGI